VAPATWQAEGDLTVSRPVSVSGAAQTLSVKADSPDDNGTGDLLLSCDSSESWSAASIGTLTVSGHGVDVQCTLAGPTVNILGSGNVDLQQSVSGSGLVTVQADDDCSGAGTLTGRWYFCSLNARFWPSPSPPPGPLFCLVLSSSVFSFLRFCVSVSACLRRFLTPISFALCLPLFFTVACFWPFQPNPPLILLPLSFL